MNKENEKKVENLADGFEEYYVTIPCVKKGGGVAEFNCNVCKRRIYFASPCTPDDCEERMKELCNGDDDGEPYNEMW